jgi:hypothetical protein
MLTILRRRHPAPIQQFTAPRVGDVILEDGVRAEVVGAPSSLKNGKTTRAWLRREGETVQREAVWEAWRTVRVVRRVA